MKLDKALFKTVVKECLIEILAEGLVNNSSAQSSRKKTKLTESLARKKSRSTSLDQIGTHTQESRINSKSSRPSYLDNIKFNNNQQDAKQSRVTNDLASSITKDPVMQDILADTAKTTLREQSESNRRSSIPSAPADKAAAIVEQSDPTELFGESAQNWAHLAFS